MARKGDTKGSGSATRAQQNHSGKSNGAAAAATVAAAGKPARPAPAHTQSNRAIGGRKQRAAAAVAEAHSDAEDEEGEEAVDGAASDDDAGDDAADADAHDEEEEAAGEEQQEEEEGESEEDEDGQQDGADEQGGEEDADEEHDDVEQETQDDNDGEGDDDGAEDEEDGMDAAALPDSLADGDGDGEGEGEGRPSRSPHALPAASSDKYAAALARRGVIYFSRIPPYMKAAKLRWMLEQLLPKNKKRARIGRIFLTPEDASFARRRKKSGGNTGKRFVDGWAEFESKRIARWMAEAYNAQPMGGPKRSKYAEDLWTMKYLSGFKWSDLTEKIAYEKQIRSTKIREEMTHARRESEHYLKQVNRSNALKKGQEKRQKQGEKRQREGGDDDDRDTEQRAAQRAKTSHPQHQRTFHQRALLDRKPNVAER